MYRFNRRVPRKKKRYGFLKFLYKLAIFAAIVALIWWYLTRPQVKINNGGAQLVPVISDETFKHITEPLFEFDLPSDWKEIDRRPAPLRYITWKGTSKESAARTLDIYTDAIPFTMPVNRVLPVSSQDDRLGVDIPSGNCFFFDPKIAALTPAEAAKTKVVQMTFQKIPFLCDIPNSLRNVMATGSPEGINQVSLTGVTGGKHKYFFVYTDHSAHPDDKPFPAILRSFRAR